MKTIHIIICAFLCSISASLFGANSIDCADGVCTVPDAMFSAAKNDGGALSPLDHAKMIFDTFGYPEPIVSLAEKDAEAKQWLDAKKADLADSAAMNNAYDAALLAHIYFLQKDFDSFRKYANPSYDGASRRLAKIFGPAYSDESIVGYLEEGQGYSIQQILFDASLNSGANITALEMFEAANKRGDRCNSWQVINMFSRLYRESTSDDIKEKFLKYLESSEDEVKDILIYLLCMDDPENKERFNKAEKEISKLSDPRKYRLLYDRAQDLGFDELQIEYLEKLYDLGIANEWEKNSLAKSMIYPQGMVNFYFEDIPDSIKDNPKLDKIISILKSLNNDNELLLARIYAKLGKADEFKKALEPNINRLDEYRAESLYTLLAASENPQIKSAINPDSILKIFSDKEKAQIFLSTGERFAFYNNYKKNIPAAIECFRKAIALGNKEAFSALERLISFDEMVAEFDKYPSDRLARFKKGMFLLKNGRLKEAFEAFNQAQKFGCGRVNAPFYVASLTGTGMEKDPKKAQEYLEKFISNIGDPCSTTKLTPEAAVNLVNDLFVNLSRPLYIDFLRRFSKESSAGNITAFEIISSARDMPITVEERRKLNKEFISILEKANTEYSLGYLDRIYSYPEIGDDIKNERIKKQLSVRYNISSAQAEKIVKLFKDNDAKKDPEAVFKQLKSFGINDFRNIAKAYCYRYGIGVGKDEKKALELLKEVSCEYYFVELMPIDPPKIERLKLDYLQYKATSAYAKAVDFVNLGDFLSSCRDLSLRDYAKAKAAYETAAKMDSLKLKNLSDFLLKDTDFKDEKKSYEILRDYLDKNRGNMEYISILNAEFNLAMRKLNGRGVEKDAKAAYEEFKRIGSLAQPYYSSRAREVQAYCLENGIGVEADKAAADKIREDLKDLMRSGYEPNGYTALRISYLYNSKNLLGKNRDMYKYWLDFAAATYPTRNVYKDLFYFYNNSPTHRNIKKAAETLETYSKYWGDFPFAIYRNGVFDIFGIGREKNEARGLKLLREAADKGDSFAKGYMAYFYKKGMLVKADEKKADEYMKSFLDNKEDPIYLARTYIRGSYGIRDLDEAKEVLKLGVERGYDNCVKALKDFDKTVADVMGE